MATKVRKIRLAYPDRSCKGCLRYPCMSYMDDLKCDFAKHGCREYKAPNNKS